MLSNEFLERQRLLGKSSHAQILFVDPILGCVCPVDYFLLSKPQIDLFFGGLYGIGTVDDVTTDLYAIVATDCARRWIFRIRLAQHYATRFYNVQTFPDLEKSSNKKNEQY